MASLDPNEWRKMTFHNRAVFLASNPGLATQFFDFSIKSFIDVIQLPGMTEEIVETKGELERPPLVADSIDPRIADAPTLKEGNKDTFAKECTAFITELATACNWHKHTFTCWKHLKKAMSVEIQIVVCA
ncbi:hypothetical protein PILCRDRAFT_13444 [Piloderma croceum F 1598]|uniref:Uncharacterized protein n=1 Tax=Piloderma croceum (strain F 1598) TaxID=765440 RepID=A0A0C3AP70_PILCF|nr:hypothetical protein PILCRDRAFT_13444 [Piloderma croceum F 1598]